MDELLKLTVVGSFLTAIATTAAAWLTRRTKISEFRQAWINDLRKDIADYVGVAELWILKWDELNLESMDERSERIEKELNPLANNARVILYRIQLRFNPREDKNKNIVFDNKFLASLEDLLDPKKLEPDQRTYSWHALANKSILLARELLKREWEVTKKPWFS